MHNRLTSDLEVQHGRQELEIADSSLPAGPGVHGGGVLGGVGWGQKRTASVWLHLPIAHSSHLINAAASPVLFCRALMPPCASCKFSWQAGGGGQQAGAEQSIRVCAEASEH